MDAHTRELLDLLARDAADWEKAAEDMDFVAPLLGDETHRRSAAVRAGCYRECAARDRAALARVQRDLMSGKL